MRRMAFAVLAVATALFTGLFTASVAGAQAPAATISVDGHRDDVVAADRDGHDRRNRPMVVHGLGRCRTTSTAPARTGTRPWTRRSPPPSRRSTTPSTPPGVYTFVCDVHPGMTGTVTVEDAGADPLENVLVFSETAGFRHDSIDEGIAAIQALGAANDFAVDRDRGLVRSSTPPTSPSTTPSSSSPRPATSSPPPSRTHSRTTCAPAAASSASMPRPTPSTRGRGTARCSAATSATTRPAPPRRRSTSRILTSRLRRACRPPGCGRTSGTTTSPRRTRCVGGGGDDYSPRDSGVKVLATVDESTYDEQDGSDGTDDDHPIAWCSDFDGGRVWYTGMGHTAESFGTGAGNIRSAHPRRPADRDRRRAVRLRRAAPGLADGRRLRDRHDRRRHREPDGARRRQRRPRVLRRAHHRRAQRLQPGQRPGDDGDPDPRLQRAGERAHGHRARPGLRHQQPPVRHLHAAAGHRTTQTRVSRFTVGANNTIAASSEQVIFTVDRAARSSAATPAARSRSRPTATSTSRPATTRTRSRPTASRRSTSGPAASSGTRSGPPPTPTTTTARSCASTRCRARPACRASARRTRSPTGNMFAPGTANTLPEIFAMGFRNPFRITIDPHTGWVLLGNYGPDAGATVPNRGPQGSVEFEVVKGPGFYGWPYCVRDNVPYNDYDFANSTSGPKFDCANPVNNSPNNTGITNLPPAIPATMWMGYTETDPRVPGPRHRRRADRRPALRLRPRPSTTRPSSPSTTTGTGSSASGTTAGSRPPRSTTRATRTGVFQTPCDGHVLPAARDGVRARRLALRDRLGRRLRRQQRQLRHLPDRLRGRRATPDRARDVERGQRPDAAHRAVLERRIASTPTARR